MRCTLPLNPCDNCRLEILNYVQVKSQPRCEACETGNSPCRSHDQGRYFAERSRKVSRASAGPSSAPSRRSPSQSIELSEVSPARSDSIDVFGRYWGVQTSFDHGHPSTHAPSLPLYSISSSPQSSSQDQWLSSPLMGSARPHYESGRQHSYCDTSSQLQLGNGSLRGYYTSYDIADTSNSQWDRMFNHVLPPSSSRQVNMPHLTIPVHRQNGPQSPSYSADDLKTLFIAGSSSALEVASSSVQRAALDLSADPDDAITEPIVEAVLSLRGNQWPPAEPLYLTANTPPSPDTHEHSTHFPNRPTQYNYDSLAITLGTASVSPYQQSPSPKPHNTTSHLSQSPSSPGSLSDVFTVDSQQWRNVAIAESETSPGVSSSVGTDPGLTTIPQDRTTDITVAEVPNFCHLCSVSFTQRQVFLRHLKDKHEDKESCTQCPNFKWSRGRPHLYRRHLKLKHPEVASSEDRPRRTRKPRTLGARQRSIPDRKTEATSGSIVPRPYCRCRGSISGPSIPFPR